MLNTKLLIITLALTFSSCTLVGDGTNTFFKESFNAQHTKKAILFLKEASLSSDSYQVMVCNNNYTLGKEDVGNAFTVDTNHDSTFLNNMSINFTWLNNYLLQIDYDKKLRTFIQEEKIEGVTLVYRPR